jgi:acyl-coenzyme A synthetase/AMP-(fatty) acid ligase
MRGSPRSSIRRTALVRALRTVAWFDTDAQDGLDALARRKPATFDDVPTAAEDTALIAFTSGTTGRPKGTMHFHRDVIAACDCWPRHVLRASADDRVHRHAAARVHVRARRPAGVSPAHRRLHAAAREGDAGTSCSPRSRSTA